MFPFLLVNAVTGSHPVTPQRRFCNTLASMKRGAREFFLRACCTIKYVMQLRTLPFSQPNNRQPCCYFLLHIQHTHNTTRPCLWITDLQVVHQYLEDTKLLSTPIYLLTLLPFLFPRLWFHSQAGPQHRLCDCWKRFSLNQSRNSAVNAAGAHCLCRCWHNIDLGEDNHVLGWAGCS